MFIRSVVGKLAITILLLVSFVLFILSILLLEFFENFHVQEAEKAMSETANKVSILVEKHDDENLIMEMVKNMKEPSSRIIIYFSNGEMWISDTTNKYLRDLDILSPKENPEIMKVIENNDVINERLKVDNEAQSEIFVVGEPVENNKGAIFVFQSLDVIDQTRAETTKIIFVAAAIAILLTTIFAFFLSTRITAPLIQMRKAVAGISKGDFITEVPVVTKDEIGDLAVAFNRMGKDLQFHIQALRQEKEQLSSIVKSMADGVFTLTRDGEIIIMNTPAENFIQDWLFEEDTTVSKQKRVIPNHLKELLQQVITSEEGLTKELNIQGRDWVMIMTPLYDNSYVRGAVAVIRDMTEERQLDKLRKDFISNVSHELRTPIALMQGYSEAIVDDIAESKEDKNELANIIHEESLRMSRLVNELLDIGRMEAGHIELNIDEVNINQFIDRILKKFSNMAEEYNIELEFTNKAEKEYARFDPDGIEQVLTNLIDNAIVHTKKSGYVHIKADFHHDQLTIEVEDNGAGIPEEDLSFIFERFYKADKSRKRDAKKKGTGLGLAIAKHIVNAHGGVISVKSKLNVGTTFNFKIPQK